MKGIFVLLGFMCCVAAATASTNPHDDLISQVNVYYNNKMGDGTGGVWVAGPTSLYDYDMATLQQMSGSRSRSLKEIMDQPYKTPSTQETRLVLPPAFDARTIWPNCVSIKEIRDQGLCGSCWAHAGVSVMSDRICIASPNQNTYAQLSVQDPLICSSGGTDNLCGGGYVDVPYTMMIRKGIVTGGGYLSGSGCFPYQSYTQADAAATNSSTCSSSCKNPSYQLTYSQDKYFATGYYGLGNLFTSGASGGAAIGYKNETVVKQVQLELMTYGPLTAVIKVYQDLYSYRSGIYQQVTGSLVGSHAVKLIGWGTENNVDYWILANSWGTGWGESGFFRWIRGINHLGIEDYLMGGIAKSVNISEITPSTTTTTTTTTMTTPPLYGRPNVYDRCDKLFCHLKATGYYYMTPCSRNYCYCDGNGNYTWMKCLTGMFYDKTTATCKAPAVGFCAPKANTTISTTPWAAPPTFVSNMCNFANCQGRGGDYTWYGLGLCTPYWCYCWSNVPTQAVQTCPAGHYFDFRTEAPGCAPTYTLPWC